MSADVLVDEQIAKGGEGVTQQEGHSARQSAARRGRSMSAFVDALEISNELEIPGPITVIGTRPGCAPKLPIEAFELARQVYYLQHGSLRDAARAVIAEGLAETDNLDRVADCLRHWWDRNSWPRRAKVATFAIRDANNDGGLYRSTQMCRGLTTGSGPAPAGEPCGQSALKDSDYCFAHDPRPEYVAAREAVSRQMQAARRADYVPIKPFAAWCEKTRRQMLVDAKRRGEKVHPNATGWAMLASALQIDQSQLCRLVKSGVTSRGKAVTTVSASTIAGYLDRLEVSFEDVYGYPVRSTASSSRRLICPKCGGPKNSASKVCLACFEVAGARCEYRNRRGEQCTVKTEHESGYCCRCRQIAFREKRQRVARASFISTAMLTLATGAYAETPKLVRVGERMWETNACGVCDVFSSTKTLTGSLRRQFRKRGWTTPEAIAAAHADLVQEHGDVGWPETGEQPLTTAALLPPEPYIAWLSARFEELGSYAALARRLRVSPDRISRQLRGLDDSKILRSALEQELHHWGGGIRFEDIYEGSTE